GSVLRNRCSSRPGIAVRPEGLAHLDAIFATTLLGARPTENVNPNSVSRSCLIRSAILRYDIRSGLRRPVRSAKHSSTLYSSTSGVQRGKRAKKRLESRLYVS